MNKKELEHVTNLIVSEVSYFNGWSVSQEQMTLDCEAAAKKIRKYLRRRNMNEFGPKTANKAS